MSDNAQNDVIDTPVSGESRQLGIVKWFNNKAGFGFVTTLGDETRDVFVHHSGVSVGREQYKYLVQGEYVEFELSKSDNGDHEWQATGVTGLQNGLLMCETRFLNKQERQDRHPGEDDGEDHRRNVRARGSGPRENRGGHRGGHRGDHRGGSRGGQRDRNQQGGSSRRNNQRWVLDEREKGSSDSH